MDSSMVFGVFRNLTSSALDANSAEADMDSEDMDTMFKASTMPAALTTSTTSAPDHEPSVSMNNFYPALVQCFGIIICG